MQARRNLQNYRLPVDPWQEDYFAVLDGGTIEAGGTRTFNFGGEDIPEEETELQLANIPENELLPFLVKSVSTRELITQALGMPSGRTWFWILEQRRRLLPSESVVKKPGDFDIICGVIREGRVSTEFLACIEVKRRRVRENGRAKSFPSGTGEGQALGLVEAGFDRSLLLHCLVSERSLYFPGVAATWQGMFNTDNQDAVDAIENFDFWGRGYGHMVMTLGHAPRRDFQKTHSAQARLISVPPTCPRSESKSVQLARKSLIAGVSERLGTNRTGRFFVSRKGGGIDELPDCNPI